MGLRASDPAGHHGWGGRWMRCGRRPGFRWDSPISGPTGAGPVSGGVHSTGAVSLLALIPIVVGLVIVASVFCI